MQFIGIIAEYNPFHCGHVWQLRELRRRYPDVDGIIVAMSGSFTQRGTPCIMDKWRRARHAVAGGADLVLELPFVFACRSAQDFARGGISLLSRLGVVSHLAFGTEADETAPLMEIALQIDSDPVQEKIYEYIDAGFSYAAALSHALVDVGVSEDMLRAPNNILAVEYLRALHQFAPQITPIPVQRKSVQHSDVHLYAGITSASSIRTALRRIPPAWNLLEKSLLPLVFSDLHTAYLFGLPEENELLRLLRYELLIRNTSELKNICGVAEGIENRLVDCLKTTSEYNDLIKKVSTKRYPQSRIARLIVHLLLCLQKAQTTAFDKAGASYIRPLAFNTQGRDILRQIKKYTQLPIVTRTAAFLTSGQRSVPSSELSLLQQMLSFDTRATELRILTLLTEHKDTCRTDFITSPQLL